MIEVLLALLSGSLEHGTQQKIGLVTIVVATFFSALGCLALAGYLIFKWTCRPPATIGSMLATLGICIFFVLLAAASLWFMRKAYRELKNGSPS